MTFKFGPLHIDAAEYASQGNAILGIRDSGKTYTATGLAEHVFDAGIPFFAFDPIGVWRYLRVPGKGRGYPVVVAGGKAGDLPLSVEGTPELVRAAMAGGVSLVFDLFDIHLSKADWRKIVTAAVRVMLHENQAHGLRHVFIEEAAEFVPQKVLDGIVYAEIEKLARMGGNARLGYTLINQRSQEVAKAILELCENVFLHRQRGSNALQNLDKWLQVAGAADQKKIIKSLPDLPQGQCWAWLGGDTPSPPTLIKVPEKNSLHPDRRVMRGDVVAAKAQPVDVAEFIARMRGKFVDKAKTARAIEEFAPKVIARGTIEATEKAIRSKETAVTKDEADTLRAENADLKRRLAALEGKPPPAAAAPVSIEQSLDNETLYQAIKARLAKEAPGILKLLTVKPEIEVKVERKVIEADSSGYVGRIARMIAGGFFTGPCKFNEIVREMERTGPRINNISVNKALAQLHADGFLTKEGSEGFRAVESMKVNVVEA